MEREGKRGPECPKRKVCRLHFVVLVNARWGKVQKRGENEVPARCSRKGASCVYTKRTGWGEWWLDFFSKTEFSRRGRGQREVGPPPRTPLPKGRQYVKQKKKGEKRGLRVQRGGMS